MVFPPSFSLSFSQFWFFFFFLRVFFVCVFCFLGVFCGFLVGVAFWVFFVGEEWLS